MSITAYTGLPGHGKSYGVTENVIIPALESKRLVYTNIPINNDVALERYHMSVIHFDINDIIDNEHWWTQEFEKGSLIIIDECWRLWPSGLKANNARDSDKEFLAEHRHMVGSDGRSTEIVFVTQDLQQIASFARILVESTFRVTKLSKIGADKTYRVDVYSGAVGGPNPPISKREREIPGRFKKSVYQLYKSHTKSTVGAGNESRVDRRFNILGSLALKLGIVFIIVMCVVIFYGSRSLGDYYGSDSSSQAAQALPSSPAPVAPSSPVISQPVYKFLSLAQSIHVTGFFQTKQGSSFDRQYFFEVSFDDASTHLTGSELVRLSYELEFINDCLVFVNGPDYDGFATCPEREEPQSFFDGLTNGESGIDL